MARARKIALLIPNLAIGGAERLFVDLAGYLQRNAYEVEIFTLGADCEWQLPVGVRWTPLISASDQNSSFLYRFLALPLLVFKLRRLTRREHTAAVYSGLFRANIVAILTSKLTRTPTAISLHSYYSEMQQGQPFKQIAAKLLYPLADATVFVTTSVRDDFLKNYTRRTKKNRVIPNFLPNATSGDEQTEHSKPKVRPGQQSNTVIGTVARLVPLKNLDTLIGAMPIVRREMDGVRLIVVGDGPEMPTLRTIADSIGAADYVDFVGASKRPFDHLESAALYVQPSLHESFGLAPLEAMFRSLPTVLSDIPAFQELSDHGTAAVLTQVSNAHVLANTLLALLKDPDRLMQIGALGRRRALEFHPDAVLPLYRLLFGELIVDSAHQDTTP